MVLYPATGWHTCAVIDTARSRVAVWFGGAPRRLAGAVGWLGSGHVPTRRSSCVLISSLRDLLRLLLRR